MMKRCPLPRNQSALTLLELVIAVAIVIIISAMAFPALQSMRLSAKGVQCLANIRTYGTAVLTYAADHSGFPWWDGTNTANHTAGEAAKGSVRPQFEFWLRPYLQNTKAGRMRCPLITAQEIKDEVYRLEYAGNGGLCMYYPKLQGIPVPASRVVLAAESGGKDGFYHTVQFNMTMWGLSESDATKAAQGNLASRTESQKPQYHGTSKNRGLNLFFLDGHASLVRPARGDWRAEPTFGTATNTGYFYHRDQFKHMKENPGAY